MNAERITLLRVKSMPAPENEIFTQDYVVKDCDGLWVWNRKLKLWFDLDQLGALAGGDDNANH